MEEDHEPKLSIPEIIIILPFVIALDAIGMVLALFLLDDFWILDIFGAGLALYLFLRGLGWTNIRKYTLTAIGELIPYVDALPLFTIGFLLTVWADRNPKVAQVMTIASSKNTATSKGAPASRGGTNTKTRKDSQTTSPEKAASQSKSSEQEIYSKNTAPETNSVSKNKDSSASQSQKQTPDVSETRFGIQKEPFEELEELFSSPPAAEQYEKPEENNENPKNPRNDL